jgi:hypothetical protein
MIVHGLPDLIPDDLTGVFTPSWINDATLAGPKLSLMALFNLLYLKSTG